MIGGFLALIGGLLGGCQLVAGDFKIDIGKLKITCEPNAIRCSEENEVQRCVAGHDWQVLATCSLPNVCNLATLNCAPCVTGSAECDYAQPKQCDASGAWQTVGQPCASAALCTVEAGGESASCAMPACKDKEVTCNGATLQRCRADLSGWQPLETCSSEMACTAAAAVATAQNAFPRCGDADTSMLEAPVLPCELNQFQCTEAALKRCTADGMNVQQLKQCDSTALCDSELGRCFPSKCVGGAIRCVGDVKQQCLPDFTGWDVVKTCDSGLCNPTGDCAAAVCTDGDFRCNDVEEQQCVNNVWTNLAQCDKADLCDAMNGICKPAQ